MPLPLFHHRPFTGRVVRRGEDSSIRKTNQFMEKLKHILEQASLRTVARGIKNWKNGLALLLRTDARLASDYLSGDGVKALQIGTGPHPLKGWLNSDLYRREGVVHLDATRPFPFPDASFNFIFSEHMIEHVPWGGGFSMLKECHRVLKPGGKIRLVTPDLNRLLQVTGNQSDSWDAEYLAWYHQRHFPDAAIPGKCWMMNNFMHSWGHQFIYDEQTLTKTLEKVGFSGVRRGVAGTSEESIFQGLENEDRMPPGYLNRESLVLEAVKV